MKDRAAPLIVMLVALLLSSAACLAYDPPYPPPPRPRHGAVRREPPIEDSRDAAATDTRWRWMAACVICVFAFGGWLIETASLRELPYENEGET